MRKFYIIALLILGFVAASIWWYAASSVPKAASPTSSSQSGESSAPKKVLSPTEIMYASMSGDDFDKAYLSDMIAHHQGALNMASYAQSQASRPEIKKLASDILTTQSDEVRTMMAWQQEWGYVTTDGSNPHAGHAMEPTGSMADSMAAMTASLANLNGDAFDSEFLKQMIVHHQQAIDMSKYADANAKYQELKDLAKAIIRDQEKEIADMKSWQRT